MGVQPVLGLLADGGVAYVDDFLKAGRQVAGRHHHEGRAGHVGAYVEAAEFIVSRPAAMHPRLR